jgi:hypothetical protein
VANASEIKNTNRQKNRIFFIISIVAICAVWGKVKINENRRLNKEDGD